MKPIMLVATREFLQVARTRAFWITLMIVPLMIAVSVGVARWLRPSTTYAYILVDPANHAAAAIEWRVELDYQRQVQASLSTYIRRWQAKGGNAPAALNDGDIQTFLKDGGAAAVLARIKPQLDPNAPPFQPPSRQFIRITAPMPTDQGAEAFGAALTPLLQQDVDTPEGKHPLAAAIFIPVSLSQPVRIWTNSSNVAFLTEAVRNELTRVKRMAALSAFGVPPDQAAQIDALNVPIEITAPPVGGGRNQMRIRSALPAGLAYLLLITVMITGARMLQGVIEERANKLLESILACIRPSQLMAGKLIGLGAIGLTVALVWLGCAAAAAMFTPGMVEDFLRPALAGLNQPWMIAALLFYFAAGYLMISMIYLTIGSLSNSMQDANAYLMPVTMVILMPVIFLMNAMLLNPSSPLPRILSWIPLYTPFAMLARLGSGVTLIEVLGTGALLIAFVAAELFLLGRVFQASLLSSGQPPKLGAFVKLMFQPAGD